MQKMRGHIVMENKHNGNRAIKLTDKPYEGIIFSYGRVSFDEQEDNLKINFHYDIHDDAGYELDQKEFEQYLGDFLQELLRYGLENNEIIYTGGIDENVEQLEK